MQTWKDRFTIFQLIASPTDLAEQLKQYGKACRRSRVTDCIDYAQWLKGHASQSELNRFADSLLQVGMDKPRYRPIVSHILWSIELYGLLPGRRLQMEFLQLNARPLRRRRLRPQADIALWRDQAKKYLGAFQVPLFAAGSPDKQGGIIMNAMNSPGVVINKMHVLGMILVFLAAVSSVKAEFKVSNVYGEIIDQGEYLTYEWHVQVAEDSTEPMYAIHFATDSLYELGYYNFQSSRGWGVTERIHEYTGTHLTVWYECTYSNRIFPGDSIMFSADINKRFIADQIGPGVMIMTGLTLVEGGEGIIAGRYVPLAVLHSSVNGMLKSWANQYGLVPPESRMRHYNAAEIQDPDGDGVSSLQEFIEDTDPTVAESYMQVLAVPSAKGSVTVSAYPLSERAVYEVYGCKNSRRPKEYVGSFTAETGGLIVKGRGKYKEFELVTTLRD